MITEIPQARPGDYVFAEYADPRRLIEGTYFPVGLLGKVTAVEKGGVVLNSLELEEWSVGSKELFNVYHPQDVKVSFIRKDNLKTEASRGETLACEYNGNTRELNHVSVQANPDRLHTTIEQRGFKLEKEDFAGLIALL